MANHIQFRAQCCQKCASHEKEVQIKVVRNWISYKKVRKHICLSLSGVELEGSKDWPVRSIMEKYYDVGKRQISFNLGLNTAKNTQHTHTKKSSNKSLSPSRVELGGLKDLKLFFMWWVFLATFSPKPNVICHFHIS